MQRSSIVVVCLGALVCGLGGLANGVKLNQLMVKYGVIPKLNSLFDMPRTVSAALAEGKWAIADDLRQTKGFSVWCRDNDYRVCLLMDLKDSVAGIQVSHSVADLNATGVPQDYSTLIDWTPQTVLGTPVYSATAYFVDPSTLLDGGRDIEDDTNTAEGIWIEQFGAAPLRIPFHAPELEATTSYTKQGCLFAQGRHYFNNLTKASGCTERGPYYMLYEADKGTMLGFGVIIFGKTSQMSSPHRQWFINPPYIVANLVAPNGPTCTKEWMKTYGSTSLHVFFRERPWLTMCSAVGQAVDTAVDGAINSIESLTKRMKNIFG